MAPRQFCTPHVISAGEARSLDRVRLGERAFDESWLQSLLFQHPTLLPVDDVEPLFGPLVPVARELPTSAGPVDVVYLNPDGFLTLVETKLWRNPGARREAVAQIIDYATAMSKWSFEDLCDAVSKAPVKNEAALRLDRGDSPEFEAARFIDTVSRNLSRGRFLLLIAGDGIQEGAEHLVETLAKSPQLGFSLALIELAIFRFTSGRAEYLVQPRTVVRTREVVRAVIQVKGSALPADIQVAVAAEGTEENQRSRGRQHEELFFESLAQTTSVGLSESCQAFLSDCKSMGIELTGKGATVGMYWFEPSSDERFTFGSIYANGGWVEVNYVPFYFEKWGIDPSVGRRYIDTLASLVPGARVQVDRKAGKDWVRVLVGARNVTFSDLLPKQAEWLAAIRETMESISATVEKRS